MPNVGRPRIIRGYFGEWMDNAINERGISFSKIAEDMGVARSTLMRYCNKTRAPNCMHLYAFAYYFNVNVNTLIALVNRDGARERGRIRKTNTSFNES